MESDESNSSSTGNSRESSPAKEVEDGASTEAVEKSSLRSSRSRSSSSSSSKSSSSSSSSSSTSASDDEAVDKAPNNDGDKSADGNGGADAAAVGENALNNAGFKADTKKKSLTSSSSSSGGNSSSSSSSSDEADNDNDNDGDGDDTRADRNKSVSPAGALSQSSRQSFLSSVRSHSNSPFNNQTASGAGDININHEDLSDVSDMESEKRDNSKQSLHDMDDDIDGDGRGGVDKNDDEDGLTNDSLPSNADTDRIIATNGHKQQTTTKSNDDNCQDDLRNKIDFKKKESPKVHLEESGNGVSSKTTNDVLEDLVKEHDDDALDFEAEEGECQEICKEEGETVDDDGIKKDENNDNKKDGAAGAGDNAEKIEKEELEEGEVSDEDEKRPEETEPKPVCRFYTRGQCTWGMSCRFLHPGVTDKGNYTMFESMVRSVPMPQTGAAPRPTPSGYANHAVDYHDYRTERPPLHHRQAMHHPTSIYGGHHEGRGLLPEVPVVVENAWERGLRTAKEMMRKANKRKEQDMDFEDKKMNLTLSPDEMEKDPYYMKERPNSPTNQFPVYSPPERYARGGGGGGGQYMPPPYDDVDAYGRMTRYRELPPHRMPQYEDDRRLRPAREVIVQRVETVGRGDEWSDPWMRAKSPGGRSGSYDRDDRRRRDRRSYSSNTSYSSSNSSQSDSSSESSRSSSVAEHKRRYGSHKAPPSSRRHAGRSERSPSPVARRARRSPNSVSPSTYKRSATEKKTGFSPASKRKKTSPPNKKLDKARRRHSSSSSDSGSSYSDSDSGSSSSDSSSGSKERTPQQKRPRASDKALNERKPIKKQQPVKKRSPISIEIKKPNTVGVSALASPTHSTNSDKDNKKSRREELLKQLRAVEDAIAKKRSKLV